MDGLFGYFLLEEAVNVTPDLTLILEMGPNSLSWVHFKENQWEKLLLQSESCASYTEVYFGAGTKLTVLDKDRIREPTVTLFPPSDNECQNDKDKRQKKKTLVCAATGFFPDHVSFSWEIDGEKVTDGVATDSVAMEARGYYNISSRLRVQIRQWFKIGTVFNCTVSFFNGNETSQHSKRIEGVYGPGPDTVRGKYLRITQTAKLTYGVLIVKSCVYGAVVVFVVWWCQRSSGKQSH